MYHSLLRDSTTLTTHPCLQLDLPKPLGLKFARGNDGGAYVVVNDPKLGNTDPRVQVRHTHAAPTNPPHLATATAAFSTAVPAVAARHRAHTCTTVSHDPIAAAWQQHANEAISICCSKLMPCKIPHQQPRQPSFTGSSPAQLTFTYSQLRCCTSHVWSKSPDVHPAVLTPPPC